MGFSYGATHIGIYTVTSNLDVELKTSVHEGALRTQ